MLLGAAIRPSSEVGCTVEIQYKLVQYCVVNPEHLALLVGAWQPTLGPDQSLDGAARCKGYVLGHYANALTAPSWPP